MVLYLIPGIGKKKYSCLLIPPILGHSIEKKKSTKFSKMTKPFNQHCYTRVVETPGCHMAKSRLMPQPVRALGKAHTPHMKQYVLKALESLKKN